MVPFHPEMGKKILDFIGDFCSLTDRIMIDLTEVSGLGRSLCRVQKSRCDFQASKSFMEEF